MIVPRAWLALAGAVLVGLLTALQARINGQLGLRLDDGLTAAAISFGSGLLILTVLSASLPAGRRGIRRLVEGVRSGTIAWWMLAGGAAGALTVATQGLAVGVIGVSSFTVGVVAGQTVFALVLDRVGYGPGGVVAVTVGRLAGAALALIAVAVALGGGFAGIPWWMLALPFATGAGIAWQVGTNGRLRQRVGSSLTATLVNFVGGTVLLVIAAAIKIGVSGLPAALPSDPWLYIGGPIGVVFIFMSAALVAHTGVLLLGLGSVVGLLAGAVALDAIWPAQGAPEPVRVVVMVVVALAAVITAALPWRRRALPVSGSSRAD